jgi:MarR family transcriptional regulator for hemolysin
MDSSNSASISSLLYQIGKQRRNLLNKQLTTIGLYAGQDVLLQYLSHSPNEGMMVLELAEKMAVQTSTVSNMIRRMEAGGLIHKESDALDKRALRISITPKGTGVLKEVAILWKEMREQTVKGLTEKEQENLNELLEKIRENVI